MLENVFSWSKSRDEQFSECQRKYYYDKYVSWGGWDRNAPPLIRQAYVLKNLKNRWAWKGERVHHLIEEILKAMRHGQTVGFDAALERLTEGMRADYRGSKAKKNWEDPKKNLGLFEMEYAKDITGKTWKEFHDSSAECLKNFFESDLYQELLKDDKKSWLAIEDLEEFEFDAARVYVKLDFAREKNGKVEIFDWKTGKDDGQAAAIQIGTYAMYAMRKWDKPLDSVRAFLFNLGSPKPVPSEQAVSQKLINETILAMAESIKKMRALLSDPDKNVPLAAAEFKFTNNERLCNYCNFYRICEKYQKTPVGSR
jgi:hypothetical protein